MFALELTDLRHFSAGLPTRVAKISGILQGLIGPEMGLTLDPILPRNQRQIATDFGPCTGSTLPVTSQPQNQVFQSELLSLDKAPSRTVVSHRQ